MGSLLAVYSTRDNTTRSISSSIQTHRVSLKKQHAEKPQPGIPEIYAKYFMESAHVRHLYARAVDVSEIEHSKRMSTANEWDFWFKNNECVNTVQNIFHVVFYLLFTYWDMHQSANLSFQIFPSLIRLVLFFPLLQLLLLLVFFWYSTISFVDSEIYQTFHYNFRDVFRFENTLLYSLSTQSKLQDRAQAAQT